MPYNATTLEPTNPIYFAEVTFTATVTAPASDGGFVKIPEGSKMAAYTDDDDLAFVWIADGRWLQVSPFDYSVSEADQLCAACGDGRGQGASFQNGTEICDGCADDMLEQITVNGVEIWRSTRCTCGESDPARLTPCALDEDGIQSVSCDACTDAHWAAVSADFEARELYGQHVAFGHPLP